jgi:predicted transposase YbfD/YdcC
VFGISVRAHWGIENSLHMWPLDLAFMRKIMFSLA